jgi:hypothetical protein
MPTKRTLFLHPNPLHDPESLATAHSLVIFCVGDDRFAIDFTSTAERLITFFAALVSTGAVKRAL